MTIRPLRNFSDRLTAAVAIKMLLAASSLFVSTPVEALTLVTERQELRANDSLDFGSLGRVFDPFSPPLPDSFLPNSFSAASENDLLIDIDIPVSNDPAISPPFVFQTGSLPTAIPTNFADGDLILFTGAAFGIFPAPGNPGPLTIDFETPVAAAGTQIAVDDTFSFTATVTAFDPAGNLLDSFSVPGTSSIELDNSAQFLGVASQQANIARLVYTTSESNRAIGINTVSITTSTIPEPSALLGLVVVAGSISYCYYKPNRTDL